MNWSEDIVLSIWEKGTVAPNYDPKKYRKDECKAWMKFDEYGNRDSSFGWDINHIGPMQNYSTKNLIPLQWENYIEKNIGSMKCKVTSSGNKNIQI